MRRRHMGARAKHIKATAPISLDSGTFRPNLLLMGGVGTSQSQIGHTWC